MFLSYLIVIILFLFLFINVLFLSFLSLLDSECIFMYVDVSPPSNVTIDGAREVLEGQQITFTCSARGFPSPTITYESNKFNDFLSY